MKYATRTTPPLSIDTTNHRVKALVSSGEVTRNGTICLNSAFDLHLGPFLANPVFLLDHASEGSPSGVPILGRILSVETSPQGVVAEFQYAYDQNPRARVMFDMIAGGFAPAFSIGFVPIKTVRAASPPAEKAALPAYARAALDSGAASEVYSEVELWEISQVAIGADRLALVQSATGRQTTAPRATEEAAMQDAIAWALAHPQAVRKQIREAVADVQMAAMMTAMMGDR